jgi:hypothetical protein
MHTRNLFVEFIFTFVIAFVVTVLVTLLWSLIGDGSVQVDWETSFRFGIIFSIVVPLLGRWGQKKKE